MPHTPPRRWRTTAAAVALAGSLALAAPAAAEPVKAGPAVPNELSVLATGGALETPSYFSTDSVAIHRLSTTDGAYRGRIAFPSDGASPLTVLSNSVNDLLNRGSLKRSVDGRYLTFAATHVAPGSSTFAAEDHFAAVRVAADRSWNADTRFGPDLIMGIGQEPIGVKTVDGSRFWAGVYTYRPFLTVAPGEPGVTMVSGGLPNLPPTNLEIADGVLYGVSQDGLFRMPGGPPTTPDTTTVPQSVLPLQGAFDVAFVDTDGVDGSDTAYFTRGDRGLWKFVRSGDAWVSRGAVSGSFSWVTARAVAGAVELYVTNKANTRVQKIVDTAEIGATLTTTGVTTIGRAPSRVRYTGLAFSPGAGFPADSTPYPSTPPTIQSSTSGTVDTHVGAKVSLELDVFDPNTPASDLTVTAGSSNTTTLPNDRITITGDGATRTVTLDPAAPGSSNVTFTVRAGDETGRVVIAVRTSGAPPEATGHYYSGAVDLSAAVDAGDGYFLGVSDEINRIHLYKAGVSGTPLSSFDQGFPGGETDFEGAARFGDTIVWTASHGNNRSGSARPERRFLAFTKVSGRGIGTDLAWSHSYTRLWDQWKAWDAANGHGLGANKLKFDTATVRGLIPNAPNGFNVEGLTSAPGSSTTAWFGMRAPTITGADGIERALILQVTNMDKLTSDAVNAEFGAPIFLDLGGRSIRDIAKNENDQYLITAGTGDTDDSLKSWALYTWDGNPTHDPQFVKLLPTDESNIGAWEGIAHVPTPLGAGSRVLMTADSGDTGLGKSYGQYVTLGEPVAAPAAVTGVTATPKPGALDVSWEAAARADRYYISVKTPDGRHAPGSPFFSTGTSRTIEPLTAGTEYSVVVRAQNVATRSASSTVVKATPVQGARVVTTTSVEYVGAAVNGHPHKAIATVSAPGARGTIQFFDGNQTLQDAVDREPEDNQLRFTFPVVDGKAEINLTGRLQAGMLNLNARFTSTNPEEYLASNSPVTPKLILNKDIAPDVELVSITGDRVEGSRLTLTYKLRGYTPLEVWPTGTLPIDTSTRFNGAANKTTVVGEITAQNPTAQYGTANFDAFGVATFTTTTLPAGKHRISGYFANYSVTSTHAGTDEIPVTIAPAGSPPAAAPAIEQPKVFLTVEPGPRVEDQPVTLTARLADPTLQGTVQFVQYGSTNLGQPVPVVNGVATRTGTVIGRLPHLLARFEPAADRDTTASAVSPPVTFQLGVGAPLPLPDATATTTTLSLDGEGVVGSPLTAAITVTPAVAAPFAANDVNGSIELRDNGAVIDLVPVLAGKGEADLGGLGAGAHALEARYVPADPLRSAPSAAGAAITIVAQTVAEAPVGGSVPATLSLALGTPASFGAFVPGVAREYTATTTATVVSTAGDATLSVADPSTTATGHLVNGTFALPRPLQGLGTVKAYPGPVSNDVAAVEFKQSIGANDALRTGAYAKTLTFTLSTSTP